MVRDWLRHIARIYLPVYEIESDTLKIIYAGYSPIKKNYYSRLLLSSANRKTFLGRYWFKNILNLFSELDVDFIFSEISPNTFNYFRNSSGFIIPVWTTTRIDIGRSLAEIIKSNATDFPNVLRRIRKFNLTYEILTGEENFISFRERFYQPYISRRHGDEAYVENLDDIWKATPTPFFMAVKENGNTVGMSLLRKDGDYLYLKRIGLIDGDEEYLQHGVIGAFYYFGIVEGQKLGCRTFDLGGTRPFLSDGLTKYKLGLGAEFVINLSPEKEYVWFGFNNKSVTSLEVLKKNPFMSVDTDFNLKKNNLADLDLRDSN
jgi:hypothetical protein